MKQQPFFVIHMSVLSSSKVQPRLPLWSHVEEPVQPPDVHQHNAAPPTAARLCKSSYHFQ